ncbi:MAG: hypothetical protein RL154_349 [Pseudomonadota bacterium]|jgi:purine-binding chemotaxis protein CheW
MTQLITFKLSNELYGIEVESVREILTYQKVTEIPNVSSWVKGVINLRGDVTPILDLRLKFHVSETPDYSERTIVIAAKTKDLRMIGVVVDSVEDLVDLQGAELSAPPEMGISIPSEYIRCLIKKNEDMILVLDMDKLLDKSELEGL